MPQECKKKNLSIKGLKQDQEGLRWFMGYITKSAYFEPSSHVHLFLSFSIFSVKLMNWDLEKVFLQAYNEKW